MNTNRKFAPARLAIAIGVAVIALSFMRPSAAQAETASEFVANLGESAIEVLADQSISANTRVERFYSLLEEGFDFPLIGRFVLGIHWRRATDEQRAEYSVLFEQYLVNTYANRLGSYGGETLRIKGERSDPNRDTIVSSEIIQKRGPRIKVDWRVRESAGTYKVIDVIVEGISLVITQRDEFSSVIRREGAGVEGLLAQLRDRTVALNLATQ
ncbi:MAG: ABC transporter substrate-binding protein [Proteobacteria bacterium]|nr:ABC transporter substrate-binding protein [Pseudomonadota bacterium]